MALNERKFAESRPIWLRLNSFYFDEMRKNLHLGLSVKVYIFVRYKWAADLYYLFRIQCFF